VSDYDAPRLRLNAVEEADDHVWVEVALLKRSSKANELEEALRELVGLGGLKAGEEEDEDRRRHVLLQTRTAGLWRPVR
jgi:hypothetical protein